jgi:hypothetical protein
MVHSEFDYAFSIRETPHEPDPNSLPHQLGLALEDVNQLVNGLISFLWFIKDNSVNASEIMGHISNGIHHSVFGMSSVSIISNCHGENKEVSFTRDEIDQAYALSRKYTSICPQNEEEFNTTLRPEIISNNVNDAFKKGENDNINYNSFNRIERAIKFLQIVRETNYLPRKISLYMPIFECLFSTEAEGVSHKVSERVAFYLGDDRKTIFADLKSAYNIRSRYLHGDEMDKAQTSKSYQMDLSTKIDEITRRVLTQIITEDSEKFLMKKDPFRTYLNNIIFE